MLPLTEPLRVSALNSRANPLLIGGLRQDEGILNESGFMEGGHCPHLDASDHISDRPALTGAPCVGDEPQVAEPGVSELHGVGEQVPQVEKLRVTEEPGVPV